jgi:hypothetical protein
MKCRIEYANKIYRERCEACHGRGEVRPVHHGEREAPDGREPVPCEECDGTGVAYQLEGAEAEEAALYWGILSDVGAVDAGAAVLAAHRGVRAAGPGACVVSRMLEGWTFADGAHASEAIRGVTRIVVEPAWVTVEVDTRDAGTISAQIPRAVLVELLRRVVPR